MVLIRCLKFPSASCLTKRSLTAAAIIKPTSALNHQHHAQSNNFRCKHTEPKYCESFRQSPCGSRQLEMKLPAPGASSVRSFANNCRRPKVSCGTNCMDMHPRFELLHFKCPSVTSQKYQRTCCECPEFLKKPKVAFCCEKIKHAKLEKRPQHYGSQIRCQPTCFNLTSESCRHGGHLTTCERKRSISNGTSRETSRPACLEFSHKTPQPKQLEHSSHLTPKIYKVWAHYQHKRRTRKAVLH